MDYKEQDGKNTRTRTFHPLQFAIIAIAAVLIITYIISRFAAPSHRFFIFSPPKPTHIPISVVKKAPWQRLIIRKNDNLQTILKRHHFMDSYYELIQLPLIKQHLKQLHPHEKIYVLTNKKQALQKLVYLINHEQHLEVIRQNGKFQAKLISRKLTKRTDITTLTIHRSLLTAAHNAGLPYNMILKLSKIFSWKINFSKQIRPGDKLIVMYNQYYAHDKRIKTGKLLAARLVCHQKTYEAIRYSYQHGKIDYYTPKGKSLKKAFLRAPVKYKYVSSPFNSRRMHPILHIVRPHEGVDLAAPTGTPIHAASDGEIIFRGRRGGYGKAIIIRHSHHISTLYAHMSRFSKHYHIDSRVKEGDVIGYVGQTGLATGPHLHYEYRINGVHYDPMKVKLPNANPVPKKYRPAFIAYANRITKTLDQYSTTVS